ncbi:hypothetical protein [uncultured Ruminococcus sp.]|uniref:hypothetical protein n=1 Tax=uncultured Ruminococcus sp. TaxID=165186 RepID=UPI0026146829|nr:hypothetical protein [uncultured Ruminococcus sp.]
MSQVKFQLIMEKSVMTIIDRIAAFTLEKEIYTPYSQLTATCYGTFSTDQFQSVYRIRMLLDDTEIHLGTVEQLRLVRRNGVSFVQFTSRGLTAMLLQNQLTPGLHTGMSLDGLMTEYYTFPQEITWEHSTDTSNYLYVKENTSMWDGAANLTYKLYERYPFIYGANEIRMHLPESYTHFYGKDSTLLGAGMVTDQSRIYSDFYMADVDDDYGAFHETEPEAAKRGIVRTRQLALDRQYLYNPQQALIFRRKFADRGLIRYYTEWTGAVGANLGDRLSYGDVLDGAVITHIRMTGNQKGIRTRLEAYLDAFYNT